MFSDLLTFVSCIAKRTELFITNFRFLSIFISDFCDWLGFFLETLVFFSVAFILVTLSFPKYFTFHFSSVGKPLQKNTKTPISSSKQLAEKTAFSTSFLYLSETRELKILKRPNKIFYLNQIQPHGSVQWEFRCKNLCACSLLISLAWPVTHFFSLYFWIKQWRVKTLEMGGNTFINFESII